jgi:hypothetical protein
MGRGLSVSSSKWCVSLLTDIMSQVSEAHLLCYFYQGSTQTNMPITFFPHIHTHTHIYLLFSLSKYLYMHISKKTMFFFFLFLGIAWHFRKKKHTKTNLSHTITITHHIVREAKKSTKGQYVISFMKEKMTGKNIYIYVGLGVKGIINN